MSTQRKHEKLGRLIDLARKQPAMPTLVVHPCDRGALEAALEAARLGLITPILVGPKHKIADVAQRHELDIAPYQCIDVPHSHAAAARAVELAREGKAEALMKGSLHTDELMTEVVSKSHGLGVARRVSHCFLIDVPQRDAPVIVTDAAINIAPTLDDKADIIRNAIELAQSLGFADIRVAVLAATETVNSRMPSTVEAAALAKMAERGQITGGIVDGPLALDDALDAQAAQVKQIRSVVAGRANVLVVPDIEAGNMLVKSLTFLGEADGAGIVVGAKVPVILAGRADSESVRLASCAVAVLVAAANRRRRPPTKPAVP